MDHALFFSEATLIEIVVCLSLCLSFSGVRQTQDCRLADWQVNEVNIVVKCSNRFPIPK